MKNSASAPLTFNDIIFEGRNKSYGAYLLRQLYNRHLILATFLAISAFMLFLSIPLLARLMAPDPTYPIQIDIDKTHTFTEIDLPPVAPPVQEEIVPPAQQTAAEKFTEIKIVDNKTAVTDEVPDITKLKGKTISTITTDGPVSEIPNPVVTNNTGGTAGGTGEKEVDVIFKSAEQMPVFGSGDAELMAYLRDKFKFPGKALKAGINGTAYVSFTVTKTGDVADVKILKGLGFGVDEELIRVISSMPKWQPGKQNGREVSVSYTVPFRLNIR